MYFTIVRFVSRANTSNEITINKFHKTKEEKEEYLKQVYVQYIDSYVSKFETQADLIYWCDNTMTITADKNSMTRIIDQYFHIQQRHDVRMNVTEYGSDDD